MLITIPTYNGFAHMPLLNIGIEIWNIDASYHLLILSTLSLSRALVHLYLGDPRYTMNPFFIFIKNLGFIASRIHS